MRSFALASLRGMVSAYPCLDAESIRKVAGERVFAAVMHEKSDGNMEGLRCGQFSASQICFYDGCLIDPSGRFNPMDADELSAHWHEIGNTVEGQFSAVRADVQVPFLEVRNDFLGIGQVYFWTEHGRWLLSNSVELIARIIQSAELDSVGIALALSFGWVPGDRTLHGAIKVLPEAAHWRWEGARDDPVKVCDYPARRLWSPPRASRVGHSEVAELCKRLARICGELSKHQGVLECPITGGRDSRALVLLMMEAGVSTRYYTAAFPGSEADVAVGHQIAEKCALPYDVITKDLDDLVHAWSPAAERLVRQNDGMISLWQVVDILWDALPVKARPTRVWGIGGEIGRGNYDNPKWHYGLKTAGLAKRFLTDKVLHKSALVYDDAYIIAAQFVDQWVTQTLDSGCPIADIPDLFYTYERVRRWAGANARKMRPHVNLFAPLCTRPFVEAAFRLKPSLRFSEPLHYQMVRLNPKLHQIPFSSEPWRNQNPDLAMFKIIWEKKIRRAYTTGTTHMSNQAILLERKLDEVRDFCLARGNSDIWNYVRRPEFESLLSKTTSPEARQRHLSLLLQVVTLLGYEQVLHQTVSEDSAAICPGAMDVS